MRPIAFPTLLPSVALRATAPVAPAQDDIGTAAVRFAARRSGTTISDPIVGAGPGHQSRNPVGHLPMARDLNP